jgi:hypothetical protein
MSIKAVLVTLLSALSLVPVSAQEPRTSVRDVMQMTAKVDRIDRISRALTLKTIDNQTHTVYVGPELRVFDELKTGDSVLVRIQESVIVALRPDLRTNRGPAVSDTTAAAKKEGGSDESEVLQQLKSVVTIESADPRTAMVAYKAADGRRILRAVADPRLLEGLKSGDIIEITYTRQRAIGLERQP